MRAVLRFLFVIPLGFVAACLAAAFALLWPFFEPRGAAPGDVLFWVRSAVVFLAQAAQVGGAALLPWGLFVAASEVFAWRSLLLHAAAGLAGAFAALRLWYGAGPPHASVATALLVAGLAFALVYWLVAGRGAGGRRSAPPQRVARIETAKPENTEAKR